MDPKTRPKIGPKMDPNPDPNPGAKTKVFHWFYNKNEGIRRGCDRAKIELKHGGVITPRATYNVSVENYYGSWRFPSYTRRIHIQTAMS